MDRWLDGFTHYASGDLSQLYGLNPPGPTPSPPILLAGGPRGGTALRIRNSNGETVTLTRDNQPRWTVGFRFKIISGSFAAGVFFGLFDGATEQVSIRFDSSLRASIYRGTNLLAAGVTAFSVGQWYYIELDAVIHPTAGSATLRVNGVPEATILNANTRQSANSFAAKLQWWSGIAAEYLIADLYARDDQAPAAETGFMGDIAVTPCPVIGAGAYAEFTPTGAADNWECVNDPTPNADTDYVVSGTPGQRDTYKVMPPGNGTVRSLALAFSTRKDDGGGRQLAALVRSNNTDYPSAGQAVADAYGYKLFFYPTNPATGLLWTPTQIGNADFGPVEDV